MDSASSSDTAWMGDNLKKKPLSLSGVIPELQLVSGSYSLKQVHNPQPTKLSGVLWGSRDRMIGKVQYLDKSLPVFFPHLLRPHKCPLLGPFLAFDMDCPVINSSTKLIKHLYLPSTSHSFLLTWFLPVFQDPFSRKSSLNSQPSGVTPLLSFLRMIVWTFHLALIGGFGISFLCIRSIFHTLFYLFWGWDD